VAEGLEVARFRLQMILEINLKHFNNFLRQFDYFVEDL